MSPLKGKTCAWGDTLSCAGLIACAVAARGAANHRPSHSAFASRVPPWPRWQLRLATVSEQGDQSTAPSEVRLLVAWDVSGGVVPAGGTEGGGTWWLALEQWAQNRPQCLGKQPPS